MSVKIMGIVWDLDLPQNEKFVLLAYADHADHDGRNIFPAIATIAKKTGYSERSVQRTTKELEEKGYLIADGKGPRGTNKWKFGRGDILSGVTSEAQGVTFETKRGDIAVSPEPSLTIKEPPQKKDLVDGIIELSQMPGVKKSIRLDGITSRIAVRLHINPSGRNWEDFIRFVDDREQKDKQNLDVFLNWLTSQNGFDISYWPPDKMRQHWPRAFVTHAKEDHTPEILKAKDDAIAKAVPRPANIPRPKISHPQPISEIMKGM